MTRRNNRYVLHRDNNVLQVDFSREPDPPAPRFPGASGLRGLGQEDSESNWLVDANHVSGPLAGQRLPAARSPAWASLWGITIKMHCSKNALTLLAP